MTSAVVGEMEDSICCLCGTADSKEIMSTEDRLHRVPGCFGLVRCTTCDLVRLSPRPSPKALGQYYPSEYYAYETGEGLARYQRALVALLAPIRNCLRNVALKSLGYGGLQSHRAVPAQLVERALDHSLLLQRVAGYPWEIPPAIRDGRALDVGCGNGRYLASLVALGWRVQGVDTSPEAARSAMEAYGIPVHVGSLESAPFDRNSVDFIHMRHVIEHCEDPLGTLRRAFELLRPGGWLYVETPNIESAPASFCGRYWFGIDSPRHLWLWAVDTSAVP